MEKLNYIQLINNFWLFYDEHKEQLNSSDIALYFVLLRYCNKLNWLNPFSVNPYLMTEINPLSQNTYYKSLKNLNDLGLITWKKGKNNISNQIVTILNFKVSTNNSIDNSIVSSIKVSIGNNIKTNKTIKTEENNNFPTPKEFYNLQFQSIPDNHNHKRTYKMLIEFLFETNDFERPLQNVLNLKEQITFKQFLLLLDKKNEISERTKKNVSLQEMLITLENNKKYTKDRKSLYAILNTWLNHQN